jgi:TM2 domain-containing membrane protein YozV
MTATDTTRQLQPARGLGWGAFLSGFIPGLLQFQLGQKGRALLAFGSCTALYFVGWMLVQDRLFHFGLFSFEQSGGGLTSTLAAFGLPVTLPEILNLPAHILGSLLSYESGFEAERLWRLPRPMEDLGGFLTAGSGLLAVFWSADAHFEMRRRRDAAEDAPGALVAPGLAAGVSWLVPGLGHVMAGQRGKGILMGGAVVTVFALGMLFSMGHAVDRAIASVWWIGESLFGGGALFAALVTAPVEMDTFPEHLDLGTVLCTVAGLMNLVVMVDAFTVTERSVFPLTGHGVAGEVA